MDLTRIDQDDLNESMGKFEAALAAREPHIPEIPCERLLLVIDGSNQDRTCAALAAAVAQRCGGDLVLAYAYEGDQADDRERYAMEYAASLRAGNLEVVRHPRPQRGAEAGRSYDQILAACAAHDCHLVVVAAPYLDDFLALGQDSIGTNLEVLMSRLQRPLLVVRDPRKEPDDWLNQMVLLITPYTPQVIQTAGWALRLAGAIRMLAVVDRETLASGGALLEDLDEVDHAGLAGLQRPDVAGLVAAVQRQAAEREIRCRVTVRSGRAPEEAVLLAQQDDGMIAAPRLRDPASGAYQRARALVQLSSAPILLG